MRLGVGIIGLGYAGAQHLEAYLEHPGAEVKMICALDAEKHRRTAEERRLRLTSDYREVLESKDIDVVSICSPDHLHAEQALAAIREDREPSVTAMEGAKAVAVCLAAVESARTNRPVKVAQF